MTTLLLHATTEVPGTFVVMSRVCHCLSKAWNLHVLCDCLADEKLSIGATMQLYCKALGVGLVRSATSQGLVIAYPAFFECCCSLKAGFPLQHPKSYHYFHERIDWQLTFAHFMDKSLPFHFCLGTTFHSSSISPILHHKVFQEGPYGCAIIIQAPSPQSGGPCFLSVGFRFLVMRFCVFCPLGCGHTQSGMMIGFVHGILLIILPPPYFPMCADWTVDVPCLNSLIAACARVAQEMKELPGVANTDFPAI